MRLTKSFRSLIAVCASLSLALTCTYVASAEELEPSGSSTETLAASPLEDSQTIRVEDRDLNEDEVNREINNFFLTLGRNHKLAYRVQENGNYLFFATVDIPDSDPVEFYYDLPANSPDINQLLEVADYMPHATRSGGNEWYPKIWAGQDSNGTWVRFNRSAQSLMYSAAGSALKAAICALPVVNGFGCAFVWGAVFVAKKVMKNTGRCPKSAPWLYVYPAPMTGFCGI